MKKDIENRKHIELLIKTFYDKVNADPTIGYIFNDIAKVNWETHLPIMYDFWENSLFYTGDYNRNTMQVHLKLNETVPLTASHFDRWLQLFSATVDELFAGEKAELAKQRAISIATLIRINIQRKGNKIDKLR
ncbi:MAG TPA: group III truncated hemoglobin [Ferruginibacter sp.]|nr:group III truncated hemoglobin [Ferruginibacter sp.]